MSRPAEIEALLDAARSRLGGLDIVVANAGLDEGLGPVLWAEARVVGSTPRAVFP